MKLWHYIIVIALCIIGILASLDLYSTFTAKSSVHGLPSVHLVEYEPILSIDISESTLYPLQNTNIYFYEEQLPAKSVNANKYDYIIMFNGNPLLTYGQAGNLSASVEKEFFNTEGELITKTVITINFKFYANRTEFTFQVTDSEAIKYLYQFNKIEGLVITLNQVI